MSDSRARIPVVTVEMLQQNRLFEGVNAATLELLLSSGAPEVAEPGDWIIREGEDADFMFAILNGELEVVSHGGSSSADVRVALLGPGDWVGEMALLETLPRSASVRALARCDLLRLTAHDMQTKLHDRDLALYARVMANIARELGRRLRVADRLIAQGSAALAKQYVLESRRPPSGK
jgi:CRP-like cAMP-binding protein